MARIEADARRGWVWLIGGSLGEALLLGALWLVPFSQMWGVLPARVEAPGQAFDGDWRLPLAIGLVFAVPSLLPALLLAPLRAPLRSLALPLLGASVALVVLPDLVALGTYPCCGGDILDYVYRLRLWLHYGANVLALAPTQHPEDWSYFPGFEGSVHAYGPLFWGAAWAATLGADRLFDYLVGFKALAALSLAASLALTWRLSPPHARLQRLAYVAWNPIILVDGLVRLHNDLLAVPVLLAAVWLWRSRRPACSLAAATLAMLIKLTVAPAAVAIVVLLVLARRWRSLAVGIALGVLLVISAYAPFWRGLETLSAVGAQAERMRWSLPAALIWLGGPDSMRVVRLGLAIAGVGLGAAYLAHTTRRGPVSAAALASAMAVLLLIGQLALPLAFYSHYLMAAVGLAAVGSDGRVRTVLLALSCAATVNSVLSVDSLAGGAGGALLDVIENAVLLAGVLGALLWWTWSARRRTRVMTGASTA